MRYGLMTPGDENTAFAVADRSLAFALDETMVLF
jgi:hypothetical protein